MTKSTHRIIRATVLATLVAALIAGCSNAASPDKTATSPAGSPAASSAASSPAVSGSANSVAGPSASGTSSQDELAAFEWGQDGGVVPKLPKRMAWANTTDTEPFIAFSNGMKAAAKDRGYGYMTAIANDNPQTNINQINSFLARGVGALMYQPLDMASQTPVLNKAISDGIFVPGLISAPSTLQIAASQYAVGYTQGKAAADWITANLGGNASVLYFNLDTVAQQLVIRHQGALDGLKTGGPGIKVVVDQGATTQDDGFKITNTALQAHPDITVVLGGDTPCLGALKALEQSKTDLSKVYISGTDGASQALDEIKKGGPYKASIAFAWPLMGYAIGQFSADWMEGKQVPRVMVADPLLLDSPAKVDQYRADMANPAAVFADHTKLETYCPLLGQVSYATRTLVWQDAYTPTDGPAAPPTS